MELILALLGLTASFFFAGSEAAYTAFNKIRLDIWKRQRKRFVKSASFFQRRPEDFFSTILIGNNLANILYTTFATVWLVTYFNETISWLIITLVVLLIGEIFPKTLFRSLADRVIRQVMLLVHFFYWLFKPFIRALNIVIDFILNLSGIKHENVKDYFSRDELQQMLYANMSRAEENTYIQNVMRFKDVKVRAAMIPRTDIIALEADSDWDTIHETILETDTPFVVLYSGSLDQIIGAVFAYDLLFMDKEVREIHQTLRIVPENKSCASLLRELQKDNISLAVVVDEYGGTAGVVTMYDLIDEVFGEFENEGQIRALNQSTWLLDAKVELDQLIKTIDLVFDERNTETIAGLILDKIGRIPENGERIEFDDFRIDIVDASNKQINKVKLIKKKGL